MEARWEGAEKEEEVEQEEPEISSRCRGEVSLPSRIHRAACGGNPARGAGAGVQGPGRVLPPHKPAGLTMLCATLVPASRQ